MAIARYKMTVEYIGTNYAGLVVQPGKRTVSSALQTALESIVGEGNAASIQWSSRTDAGVHATGNVCHVDLTRVRKEGRIGGGVYDADIIGRAINHNLRLKNHEVQVVHMELVPDAFHARYNAIKRIYMYRLIHPLNKQADCSPSTWRLNQVLLTERGRAWQSPCSLDVEKMREATKVLTGVHDFTSFRGADCVMKSPMRRIEQFDIQSGMPMCSGDVWWELLTITVRCRSFLNRQVRNMVGAIHKVGTGAMTITELLNLLEEKDRSKAPPPAPPSGLYLQEVQYSSMDEILAAAALYEKNYIRKYPCSNDISDDEEA